MDLIMDLEDVEKDEFLRDLNIVMNNKLILVFYTNINFLEYIISGFLF